MNNTVKNYGAKLFSLLIISSLMSGCAGTPATHFYQLSVLTKPKTGFAPRTEPLRIGVGPLALAAVLQREQIVTKEHDNHVAIAEFHHWAEPLQDGLLQVITHNLANIQPEFEFYRYAWSAYGSVDYKIIIDITRLDAVLGQHADLEASWVIMNEAKHQPVLSQRTKLSVPLASDNYLDLVACYNELLVKLTEQIAVSLGFLIHK
ncbi:PqiC family protein [Methylocucumis oryzae]|nr:PqiC family protein [Methylocucumis oryzae]